MFKFHNSILAGGFFTLPFFGTTSGIVSLIILLATLPGSLANTIDTSVWSPSSPDPSGIAFFPGTDQILVVDSQVPKTRLWSGVTAWTATSLGNVTAICDTSSYAREPTGVAINPDNGHIFISDDNVNRIFEVNPGADGQFCTSDDIVTFINTPAFNSHDPEDVGYGQGKLFIAGGSDAKIFIVAPGVNGKFDGVAPSGDDQVTSFSTSALRIRDPEGVAYNPDHDSLYLVSCIDRDMVETSLSGTLLNTYNLGFLGTNHLTPNSGVAYGPASDGSGDNHVYIVTRGIDDGEDPMENDGKIFEIALTEPQPTSVPSDTPIPTETQSGTATSTSTFTSIPSNTPSFTPTTTATATQTSTPTSSNTPKATTTLLPTASASVIPTNSPTPNSSIVFLDDFDPVKEAWTHTASKGVDDWGPSTTRSHSPTTAYFSSEPATIKDDYLLTRSITIPNNAQLSFWHTYKMELGYDGSVIEMTTDGGVTYTDLGSKITSGGYTRTISSGSGSPIGGRQAWTGGVLGTWTNVLVDLSSYAGRNVIIRFRMTSDNGKAGSGWFIDDVKVSGAGISPTPTLTLTAGSTFTPTPSPTSSPTATWTFTPILTNTPTATGTFTPTPINTPTVTRTFTPSLTNTPTATWTFTPTPINTPTATWTFTPRPTSTLTPTPIASSQPVVVFSENFDPVKEYWVHSASTGVDDWKPSTAYSHSPVTAYFSSEPATIKDDILQTRVITVPAAGKLSFWQTYKMELGYDGSVIEISTDGGSTFTDLGAKILSGGYNGTISNRFGNPIGGRQAWTGGVLGTWSQVNVDLGSYVGQNVIIRFRMTSDNGKAGSGWYIDDIKVSTGGS